MAIEVRACVRQDLPALLAHFDRLLPESGRDGTPYFHPFDSVTPQPRDSGDSKLPQQWAAPVGAPEWRRDFGVFDGEKMVGNLDLKGGRFHSTRHRCKLGIGIERAYCGQGHGRRLMELAIAWARTQPVLEWIDLGVFEGNEGAKKLYESLGFTPTGFTPDRFRLDGQSLGDYSFVLKLR